MNVSRISMKNNARMLQLSGSASIDGSLIFDGVHLDLPHGEWTCLLGASGVGKSTILKLFAGLREGIDFHGQLRSEPRHIALMAQDDLLLPWLLTSDNVSIGSRAGGEKPDVERVSDVLKRVGLRDHGKKKPDALSGGQRQRAALARTLMEDCPVVLLDEPFSALDAVTRANMQELTTSVLSGCTVLLVTHDPGEAARLGQNIFIMRKHGLQKIKSPSGSIPRSIDDHEVMKSQAELLKELRSGT